MSSGLRVVVWKGWRVRVERIANHWWITCPECYTKHVFNDDQLAGKVHIQCDAAGCTFHKIIPIAELLVTQDDPVT